MTRPPPKSTLFPYTTLFRSNAIIATGFRATVIDHCHVVAESGERSEEHTSELSQVISYAVFCLKKKNRNATAAGLPVHRLCRTARDRDATVKRRSTA